MGLECLLGRTVAGMRAAGFKAKNMGKESHTQQKTATPETFGSTANSSKQTFNCLIILYAYFALGYSIISCAPQL
jgi:hypothetical protein